jgi:hypothetical protein
MRGPSGHRLKRAGEFRKEKLAGLGEDLIHIVDAQFIETDAPGVAFRIAGEAPVDLGRGNRHAGGLQALPEHAARDRLAVDQYAVAIEDEEVRRHEIPLPVSGRGPGFASNARTLPPNRLPTGGLSETIAFGPAVIYAESLGYICYVSVTFDRRCKLSNQELMVRASWLYHVEGLTQAQIGERMSLTRRRGRTLGDALEKGVVRISFSSPLAGVELEARLCSRFGLEDAVVAPTPSDPAHMHAVIGRAAAAFLDRLVQNRRPRSIGVGWGATLHETVQRMTGANEPDMRIRSLMGGLTRGSEINTFEIVRSFAKVLNAKCHYFAAPIFG